MKTRSSAVWPRGIYNAAGDLGNILGPSIGAVIAQATSISGVFVIASLGRGGREGPEAGPRGKLDGFVSVRGVGGQVRHSGELAIPPKDGSA